MSMHQQLFRNQCEIDHSICQTEGKIPEWLSGSLFRNGPALYDFDHQSVNHWFDGMGMIHKFSIVSGSVHYKSRFIKSSAYKAAVANQKLAFREFATDPCGSIFNRFCSIFKPNFTTNTCVNVTSLNSDIVGLTETPIPIIIDKDSLDTLGSFSFDDSFKCQLSSAHPHVDSVSPISVSIRIGPKCSYVLHRIQDGRRIELGSIPVKSPSYQHSFGLTENYVVIADTPFKMSPLKSLVSTRSFIEQFKWTDTPTNFMILNRHTGQFVGSIKGPPFFMFHQINAYELDHTIVFDAITFENSDIISSLYLNNCRSSDPNFPKSVWSRFYLNLDTLTCNTETTAIGRTLEMPTISYSQYNALPYSYFYSIKKDDEAFFNQIVKVNTTDGDAIEYSDHTSIPSEPIFVPFPDSQQEDDGVLLSIFLNIEQQRTELHGICAKTMKLLFRSWIPQLSAYSFHGQFFKS